MKVLLTVLSTLLFIGCTQHAEHPIQLKDNLNQNISINILSQNKTHVPKDQFFSNKNWHYKQTKKHGYGYFFDNEEITATFYLAHHATHIYIRGNAHTIKKYKRYFLKNQVTAKIILIPMRVKRRGKIIIDYYQITSSIANTIDVSSKDAKSGKNLLPALSDVVEIPRNYTKKD
jgi:hypothetical protein